MLISHSVLRYGRGSQQSSEDRRNWVEKRVEIAHCDPTGSISSFLKSYALYKKISCDINAKQAESNRWASQPLRVASSCFRTLKPAHQTTEAQPRPRFGKHGVFYSRIGGEC